VKETELNYPGGVRSGAENSDLKAGTKSGASANPRDQGRAGARASISVIIFHSTVAGCRKCTSEVRHIRVATRQLEFSFSWIG
jgi:hypothetical protein